MITELWKPIKEYNEMYEVSNLGRVRSLDRFVKSKNKTQKLMRGKILAQKSHSCGYICVTLCKNSKMKTFYIHRLVAEAFIGIKKDKEVNHIDFDRTNNNINNLEVITRLENSMHSIKANRKYGLEIGIVNNENGNIEICETLTKASRITNIPIQTIYNWLTGVRKYKPKLYRYNYTILKEV